MILTSQESIVKYTNPGIRSEKTLIDYLGCIPAKLENYLDLCARISIYIERC